MLNSCALAGLSLLDYCSSLTPASTISEQTSRTQRGQNNGANLLRRKTRRNNATPLLKRKKRKKKKRKKKEKKEKKKMNYNGFQSDKE